MKIRNQEFNLVNSIVFLFVGAFVGLGCLVTYWIIQPPQEQYDILSPIVAQNSPVEAGGTLISKASFCKKVNVFGRIDRVFVGEGVAIPTPTTVDDRSKLCAHDAQVSAIVPSQLKTGEYKIKYYLEHKVNPVKTLKQEFFSEPFRVIGKDEVQ